MTCISNLSLTRRSFLSGSALGASTLLLGFHMPLVSRLLAAEQPAGSIQLNAYVGLFPDGRVLVFNPYIEMGQGTYTAIPMLVAEELDIAMDRIVVEQAPPGQDYRLLMNKSMRFTGGSFSVRSAFLPLRQAGATARLMLLQAAAARWNSGITQLDTRQGVVVNTSTGETLDYRELLDSAARQPVPDNVPLRKDSEFRLLGQPVARKDVVSKSNGSAEFGMDIRMPGMVYAAVRHAPVPGSRITNLNALKQQLQGQPGVIGLDEVPGGIALVAESYWQAKQQLERLSPEFDSDSASAGFSSESSLAAMREQLDAHGTVAEDRGNAVAALAGVPAEKKLQADYSAPMLAHVTMEPMNCAALVKNGHCTVWAPNQAIDFVVMAATAVTGLKAENITVHTPFLGGGFGRRFLTDFTAQALTLATLYPGLPVKLVWSREEDMQHDYYRPLGVTRFRAALDDQGGVAAVHATVVGDGPIRRHMSQPGQNMPVDESVVEGIHQQPYDIASFRCDYVYHAIDYPIGFWRSVGHSMNAFFKESFMDELAHATGQDPLAFRTGLLASHPRHRKVLETAAAMAGWKNSPWQGADGTSHAMGLALHESFGSIVAQVAEVSLDERDEIRVHKVWCAVDCGFAVNPRIVGMQMESAIAYGVSAALLESVDVQNGRVQASNFDSYPVLPARRMPEVDVRIINSGEALGGIGEPATPPVAPAVANALYTLTGIRLRQLPLDADQLLG